MSEQTGKHLNKLNRDIEDSESEEEKRKERKPMRGSDINAGMKNPKMIKIPPADIEVIDPRLMNIYDDPEVYKNTKESSCFINCYNCCGEIPKALCVCCAPCGCGPLKKIYQGYMGLKMRHGKIVEKLPPGLHAINSCTDFVFMVDMRQQTVTVGHVYTTKDYLNVLIKAFGVWKTTHPEIFLFKVANPTDLMSEILKGVICTLAATRTLKQLMKSRDDLEVEALEVMNDQAKHLGFIFTNIEFNEITLGGEIMSAVSAMALAKQESQAKLIFAKGERNSATLFKQAADQITNNPISLQLQYLEIMKEISKETRSTLIMPDTCVGDWHNLKYSNERHRGGGSGSSRERLGAFASEAKLNSDDEYQKVRVKEKVKDKKDKKKKDKKKKKHRRSSKRLKSRAALSNESFGVKSEEEDENLDGIDMLGRL